MKRHFWLVLPVLLASALRAAVSLPEGKGFGFSDIPSADSFTVVGSQEVWYGDTKMTGLQAIQTYGMFYPEGSYQIDTTRKIVKLSYSGNMVTKDSAGLPLSATTETGTGQVKVQTSNHRRYDAQKRPVMDISTIISMGGEHVSQDTTHWTWTHPECADDREGDTLRVWSVDAQGRCASAEVLEVTGAGTVPTGLTDHIVWNGGVLAGAFRLQGADTLLKDTYAVDADGMVTEQASYEKQGAVWVLTDRDSFVYRAGKLDQVKLSTYEEGRQVSSIVFQSTRGNTGVVVPRRATSRWIEARREGEMVVFENRSAQAVAIELMDAGGRQVGRLQVAPGSRASWTGRAGQVFWKAKGRSLEASGRLAPRF